MRASPLELGALRLDPPVVLAPMAGVTNYPFRELCRGFGPALFVGEMVAARPLVQGTAKAQRLAAFGPGESPRSLQLYGTDPHWVAEAVRLLVADLGVDHVDLNFGCPMPKITRKGGGAAIPARPKLFRRIVAAAVSAAADIPVTVKMRMGLDDARLTFLEAGRIAEDEGCAALCLHARTAEQLYEGKARWSSIAELKTRVESIPVLGNGSVWRAEDALEMVAETACDGVVIGRGCLGRPWLFRDLAAAFGGRGVPDPPDLGQTIGIMMKHARMLVDWRGDEESSMRAFRKHVVWYLRGYEQGELVRQRIGSLDTLAKLEDVLSGLDETERMDESSYDLRPDKRRGRQRVRLPKDLGLEDGA